MCTCLVGNSAHELSEDDQIVDDGGSKEGVFACVVEDNGVVATHEDLGCVLVHGTLGVTNIGNVLLTSLVQNAQE